MEKYIAKMMGRDNKVRTVSIFDEAYTDAPKELKLAGHYGIEIRESNDEGSSVPLRSWNGYIEVYNGIAEGIQVFAKDGHDLPISIAVEGEGVEWRGFVSTESRSQRYPSTGNVIEIPICGRLSTAIGYHISERGGMSTFAELLYEALILSGYSDNDLLYWPNTYGIKGALDGLSLLSVSVSRTIFLTKSKERVKVDKGDHYDTPITATAADVLSEIAKIFGYTWYERGESAIAVSRGEPMYLCISLGELKKITPEGTYKPFSAVRESKGVIVNYLEGNSSTFSKLRGCHSVTVSLDLQKINGNLFDFKIEDFAFVNSYKRPLDYSNPKQGYKFLFTQVFERQNFSNLETFIYYRMSAGTDEDWQKGWYPWDSVKLANWYYGYKQGRESKPGCFPARVSISEENPYYDPEYKPGGALNQWLVGHSFTDGFIFNPAYYETGECGFIGNRFPIIHFHKKETGVFSRGSFSFDFNVGAFPVCKADWNSPNPVTPFCRFYISLRVGEYKYKVINHHSPDGTYTEWGWVKTEEAPSLIPIHTKVVSENAFPSSLAAKDTRGSERYINRAMPNINGLCFPIWDKDGNDIVITGDVEFSIYADPNDKTTADPKQTKPRLLFLSNINFSFVPEDQYPEGYVPDSKENTRVLHRLTKMGFSKGEDTVKLRIGSFSADNSTSLSAMVYNGEGVKTIKRYSDNVEKAPEEFLLDGLYDYNNKVRERRAITIDSTKIQPFPIDFIEMSGEVWRQIAVSQNYAEGQSTIILEK